MKKLFALSLLAASGLIADQNNNGTMNNNMNTSQNNNYSDNCCPQDCCKPCCVPKPKKCIDCECYTPHFYELQCDWGVSVDIEFLYWYAREGDLSYALKGIAVNQVPTDPLALSLVVAPRSVKHLQSKWDPGFRVGLGWNSDCDGWDMYLTWTYYHNKKHSSTSVADFGLGANIFLPSLNQEVLIDPWINQAVSTRPLFDTISARWRFNLNYIDLEIGRKYWLSRCFTMRPYAALRGAWTKLSFSNTASRTPVAPAGMTNNFRDRFTNRHWGVGFLVGMQPEWYFCRTFVLYTNFDAALLWGNAKVRKHEHYTTTGAGGVAAINYSNPVSNNFSKMISILDLAIGFRWDEMWCCDRYRTVLDIGWEHHTWFDMNNRMKFNNVYTTIVGTVTEQSFQNYNEEYGNLMFGGLVIRLRFDF